MKSRITVGSSLETREYTAEEKKRLLEYMNSFDFFAVAGRIVDCVTGEYQPRDNLGFNDGAFRWSSQDIMHVDKYNAAVTDSFLERAMA